MGQDEAGTSAIGVGTLLGCWELAAWTRIDPAGVVSYPCTPQASGRIIYDVSGRVSAFLMHPDWPTQPGKADGHMFLAYSGRFSLEGDVVRHDVDMSSDVRFIGEALRRRVVVEGDHVALETLASAGRAQRETRHRLLWRRPV